MKRNFNKKNKIKIKIMNKNKNKIKLQIMNKINNKFKYQKIKMKKIKKNIMIMIKK